MKNINVYAFTVILGFLPLICTSGEWHPVPLKHRSPQSIVATDSVKNLFYSMGVGCRLWKNESGVPIDISSQFSDSGEDYLYGSFFYLTPSGEKLLLKAVNKDSGCDFFISNDYGDSWIITNTGQFSSTARVFVSTYHSESIFILDEKNIWITSDQMESFSQIYIEDKMIQKIFYSDNRYFVMFLWYEKLEQKQYGQISTLEREKNNWVISDPILHSERDFGFSSAFFQEVCPLSNGKFLVSITINGVEERKEFFNDGCLFLMDKDWKLETRSGIEFPVYQSPYKMIESVKSPGTIFAHSNGPCVSFDYGKNWETYSPFKLTGQTILDGELFQQPKNGDLYLSASGHGLYKSVDSGKTWKAIQIPAITGIGYLTINGPVVGLFNHHQSGYLHRGMNWEQFNPSASNSRIANLHKPLYVKGETLLFSVSFRDDNILRNNPLIKSMAQSLDNGRTWELKNNPEFPIYDSFQNERMHYLTSYGFKDSVMSISRDLGQNWEQIYKPTNKLILADSGIFSALKTVESGNDVYFYSFEIGQWEQLNLNLPKGNGISAIYPLEKHVMVVDQLNNCHWYSNGSWRELGHLPSYLYYAVAVIEEGGKLFVVIPETTDNRIRISRDSCKTWQDFSLNLPENFPFSKLTSLRYNQELKQLWISSLISPMWIEIDELLGYSQDKFIFEPENPDEFDAYLSPFNSEIRIKYTTPSDGEVKINLIDKIGNQTPLVNCKKRRGIHYKYIDPTLLPQGRIILEKITNQGSDIQKIIITIH